jgi:hypothetical protein
MDRVVGSQRQGLRIAAVERIEDGVAEKQEQLARQDLALPGLILFRQ